MEALETARRFIAAGDSEGARRALFQVLNSDPNNAVAWALLVTVLDDPERQAHCYRRILALEPGNREAAERLRQLTGESPPHSSSTEAPPLRCPQCAGAFEVRFVGRMRDKRALCRHCGTEVDLPDTFQRVEQQREREQHRWGTRTVDRAVVETRSDHPDGLRDDTVPQTLEELMQYVDAAGGEVTVHSRAVPGNGTPGQTLSLDELTHWLKEEGIAIPEELQQQLQEGGGFAVSRSGPIESRVMIQRTIEERRSTSPLGLLGTILRIFEGIGSAFGVQLRTQAHDDALDDITRRAGGPIPPKQRAKCPQCGATITKNSPRCTWCGLWFE
jgi:hypothetical protein